LRGSQASGPHRPRISSTGSGRVVQPGIERGWNGRNGAEGGASAPRAEEVRSRPARCRPPAQPGLDRVAWPAHERSPATVVEPGPAPHAAGAQGPTPSVPRSQGVGLTQRSSFAAVGQQQTSVSWLQGSTQALEDQGAVTGRLRSSSFDLQRRTCHQRGSSQRNADRRDARCNASPRDAQNATSKAHQLQRSGQPQADGHRQARTVELQPVASGLRRPARSQPRAAVRPVASPPQGPGGGRLAAPGIRAALPIAQARSALKRHERFNPVGKCPFPGPGIGRWPMVTIWMKRCQFVLGHWGLPLLSTFATTMLALKISFIRSFFSSHFVSNPATVDRNNRQRILRNEPPSWSSLLATPLP